MKFSTHQGTALDFLILIPLHSSEAQVSEVLKDTNSIEDGTSPVPFQCPRLQVIPVFLPFLLSMAIFP
jgi:hypothetical protein